jgi:hypothetical protein
VFCALIAGCEGLAKNPVLNRHVELKNTPVKRNLCGMLVFGEGPQVLCLKICRTCLQKVRSLFPSKAMGIYPCLHANPV